MRKNARKILKANLKYPDLEESNKAKIYVPTDAENATDEGTISNKTGKNKFQVNDFPRQETAPNIVQKDREIKH